jgi:acyl carrier protein
VAQERIEDALKKMMVERLFLKVKPESIPDDAPIMKALGVDSVAVLEIVVGLEEVYGISFEDEEFDIEIFRTVKSIADFVRAKQAAQAKAAGK